MSSGLQNYAVAKKDGNYPNLTLFNIKNYNILLVDAPIKVINDAGP